MLVNNRAIARAGNRACRAGLGRAKTGPGQNWPGFFGQNFSNPAALKTGLIGPNSLLKAKKIRAGRAILDRAKFGPIFFGPII